MKSQSKSSSLPSSPPSVPSAGAWPPQEPAVTEGGSSKLGAMPGLPPEEPEMTYFLCNVCGEHAPATIEEVGHRARRSCPKCPYTMQTVVVSPSVLAAEVKALRSR